MQRFINPEELNALLAGRESPLLLIFLDKKNAFSNQQQTLKELSSLFAGRIVTLMLDIEYQSVVTEKFKVHGFPAFIFCEQGRKKDVLLGTPDTEVLREFVARNLPDGPTGRKKLQ